MVESRLTADHENKVNSEPKITTLNFILSPYTIISVLFNYVNCIRKSWSKNSPILFISIDYFIIFYIYPW